MGSDRKRVSIQETMDDCPPRPCQTAYSHNVRNLVKKGAWVHAGQPIALVGRTGRATTEHLHFETRVRGKAFDSNKIYDHHLHSIKREVIVFTKQANGQLRITSAPK